MLSDRTLNWVIDSVHPEAIVISIKQLQGGVSSLVHGVSLRVNDEQINIVLRQFDNPEWVQRQPDLVIQEAESLHRAFRAVGVQTPRMIAFDETGSKCGTPAILMSRLDGEVVLEPVNVSRWLEGMAQSLTQIHAVDIEEFPWTFAPYNDASSLDTSSWSRVADKWKIAADFVTKHRPPYTERFIHRDFHPANVLWHEGKVSGVVDWVNGCIGPAGIDVGHCRVNLALLYQIQTADQFLALYRDYEGDSFVYDPYWDLVTLIDFAYWPPEVYRGWTDLGMTGLTNEMMAERLDNYLISLLDRIY
ncbi:MAG: aminoglycoside phosphotransferase family protein [Candidatus Cohnella colombiensis]|uniref:Aminoglycoside phosphotransferase family protein n=1 Tax=Candidatus Cohnella colombiensis TaxID=3121368 RepID=A0AA95F422_9BACL|nr:MAG: aminoglycoside phosphotransferase family protein [Cohnella sp.]